MPSSMSSELPILLNFFKVATLGFGTRLLVIKFRISSTFVPDILMTATPEIPGPDDRA